MFVLRHIICAARYSCRECSRHFHNRLSGFYSRFSRYIRSQATRTRSIYNIWNFLGNLAATLVINITFRRANQPTERFHSNSYWSYVYPALRSSRRGKVRERASPDRGEKSRGIRKAGDDIASDDLRPREYMPREIHLTRHNAIRAVNQRQCQLSMRTSRDAINTAR